MYFVVEYVDGGQAFAAKFDTYAKAKEYIDQIGNAFLDFYGEEEVIDKKYEFKVFRRVRDLKQFA